MLSCGKEEKYKMNIGGLKMNRRVVITGMGAVTSLGCGADKLWQSIKQGKSGISRIERIDVSDLHELLLLMPLVMRIRSFKEMLLI